MENTRRGYASEEIRQAIVFHHIPKTGGTAFNGVLRANYDRSFQRVKPGKWRKAGISDKARCISGHIPYGWPVLPGVAVDRLTILRDPVERWVSLYRFCLHWPKHKHHRTAVELGVTGLLEEMPFADLDNGMVRWLAGRSDVGSGPVERAVGAEDYRLAVRNLSGMRFGFQDDLTNFVSDLAVLHGWRYTRLERRMVGKHKPAMTEREIAFIYDTNRYDVDLYAWALHRMGAAE